MPMLVEWVVCLSSIVAVSGISVGPAGAWAFVGSFIGIGESDMEATGRQGMMQVGSIEDVGKGFVQIMSSAKSEVGKVIAMVDHGEWLKVAQRFKFHIVKVLGIFQPQDIFD